MLTAYVINLDRDVERWARMERLGRQFGIAWTRVTAVDKNDPAIIARAEKMPLSFYGAVIGPGAVACFESHRKIWREIVSSDATYAAIFEDDVHFSDGLKPFLSSTDWIPADSDLVRLETRLKRAKLGRPAERHFGRRVARLLSTQMGTAAYVISKQAAARLLDLSEGFRDPVDEFLFSEGSPHFAQLTVYQVIPAPCIPGKNMGLDKTEPYLRSGLKADRVLRKRDRSLVEKLAHESVKPLRNLHQLL